jgi:hypothetical protein
MGLLMHGAKAAEDLTSWPMMEPQQWWEGKLLDPLLANTNEAAE